MSSETGLVVAFLCLPRQVHGACSMEHGVLLACKTRLAGCACLRGVPWLQGNYRHRYGHVSRTCFGDQWSESTPGARYCSSDSWVGNTSVEWSGQTWYFQGAQILLQAAAWRQVATEWVALPAQGQDPQGPAPGKRRAHRCPFWSGCLKNRGPWFRWGLSHLPGKPIYSSKSPPMAKRFPGAAFAEAGHGPRQLGVLLRLQCWWPRTALAWSLQVEGPRKNR